MSDPLFGSMDFGGGEPLFGDHADAFVRAPGPLEDDAEGVSALDLDFTALDLAPALDCGLVPWHSGAFAILLSDVPAGTLALSAGRALLAILAQTRLLRPDGHKTLVVVGGTAPTAADGDLVLSVSDEAGTAHLPLRLAPAAFDRTLATLIGQALSRPDAGPEERRNWQPLTRHLVTISESAARADISLPIGSGLALVLDGDLGSAEEQAMAFALDGGQLTVTRARLVVDPQTGRSIIVLPVLAARYFVVLDDGLVDVTCPPGASRSKIARANDAMPLRDSESELLLNLVAELALDVGARVPDWLPAHYALGWRGADGNSIALLGVVAVEAGTVLFLATDNREHELANLVVRDVENAAESLFSVSKPIAAFHPDAERHPGRLHLVLLLPRRLGAGALHLSLAGTADGGGWVRTLDAAAARTQAILRAWLPPRPSEQAYLQGVAAPVRETVSRRPAVVIADTLTDGVRAAKQAVVLIAFEAEADAVERTLRSLPDTLRRSTPVVIVLRSLDPGYDRIMERLATTARTEDIETGTLVLAGPAGAAAALTVAFARLQAQAIVVVDAGARFAVANGGPSLFPPARSRARRTMIIATGSDEPAGAVLTRRLAEPCLPAVDGRLASVPAVITDIARVAAEQGHEVTRRADFVLEPDTLRAEAFDALVDRALLTVPRPAAAHRGTA